MQTFAGGAWNLELVHEVPELLSHRHSSQQTLVIEKMFMTPLGAFLVLCGNKGKSHIHFIITVNWTPAFG